MREFLLFDDGEREERGGKMSNSSWWISHTSWCLSSSSTLWTLMISALLASSCRCAVMVWRHLTTVLWTSHFLPNIFLHHFDDSLPLFSRHLLLHLRIGIWKKHHKSQDKPSRRRVALYLFSLFRLPFLFLFLRAEWMRFATFVNLRAILLQSSEEKNRTGKRLLGEGRSPQQQETFFSCLALFPFVRPPIKVGQCLFFC